MTETNAPSSEAPARPQISIDITPDGFHVSIPDDICVEDVRNILFGVKDLLIEYIQIREEERRAKKTLDTEAGLTDNTDASYVSDAVEPERG